jgi:type II secretory pathway component PulF
MGNFDYIALEKSGKKTSGSLTADTRSVAMDLLIGKGLSPVQIIEKNAPGVKIEVKSTSTRVPGSAVEAFTQELSNLLAAGLPLSRALHLLRREAAHPAAKNVWGKIHDDVVGGEPLAEAMAKYPKTFSTVYTAMVRAGEAGGFLHVVLQQISDFRIREQELRGKVKAAMVYPCVLALLATCVMVFLMTFFIPRFSKIFADMGGHLPELTQAIVAVSHAITSMWGFLIAAGVAGAVFALIRYHQTPNGKRFFERMTLQTPVLGKVAARFALVRFCRMLGTLVGSGVPLVASLKVAKEALGNQTLSDTVGTAIEEVQRGVALSKSLSGNTLLFPSSVIEMISVAEETGRLDKELVRLSLTYEGELDRNLRMLVSLAEPLMLVIMAALVGTVVVGMLLPIFNLQDMMAAK